MNSKLFSNTDSRNASFGRIRQLALDN